MTNTPVPRVLLVNPWIHDFAAYDFWARPLGLLIVGGLLEQAGWAVELLDLVDPCSPLVPNADRPRRHPDGRGKFPHTRIARPAAMPFINRKFRRYGVPVEAAAAALAGMAKPDAVLVTSMMTYWYPGVAEAVHMVRRQWPDVPVVLGGVYATLCTDHARRAIEADHVLAGPVENALPALARAVGAALPAIDAAEVLPAHHLQQGADSAAWLTSRGCLRSCRYCGVRALYPGISKYPLPRVRRELAELARLGRRNLALYDDAFLLDHDRALAMLEAVAETNGGFRLHVASGLAVRGLTPAVARAMKRAGFVTIRLGLETADVARQVAIGDKATLDEFHAAVATLVEAGFARRQIGVYVLVGLPGQERAEVEATIDVVLHAGLRPHLSEYSPVPGSPMYAEACAASRFDLNEPLFHNPTLTACASPKLDTQTVAEIKIRLTERFRSPTC